MILNPRTLGLVETLLPRSEALRIAAHEVEGGGRVLDLGVNSRGGLLAGLELARVCLAGLGEVTIVPGEVDGRACPVVQVTTDHPVAACLWSQYAGWAISEGKFFAMGSGPMRARLRQGSDLRRDGSSRGRPRTGWSACSKGARCRRPRSWPRSPNPAA